jgi:iron complex outermembrane receptor protein
MYVAACLAAGSLVVSSLANAQTAEPAPAPAQPAPSSSTATPLPPVTVEAAQQPKKAPAKKKAASKQKSSAPAVASQTPQQQPAQAPTGPGNSNASDKTAYGPVANYNAKNTATGTKTDTPLKEVPQSISVVGAEQIRDMGAQSEQEVLRYVPGVVADSYGNDGRADGSFIRGIDATTYLDGMRRTFDYYTSSYRIDPYFMERVEVLRGPASVLFGQASVGGIINSVSKRPQTEEGGEITVEYGSFDFKQVKFDMTGPITSDKRWSYRLTGAARDADTQVDYVENDRYAIQPAITFRPDSSTTITVLGHFQKDKSGSVSQFFPHVGTIFPNVNGQYISQNRFSGEPGDHYDTDVASGTLFVEHKFDETFKLKHVSSYTDVHNDYASTFSGHFYTPTPYLDPDQTTMARIKSLSITDTQVFTQDTNLEAKFATGLIKHKVVGGADYANFKSSSISGNALNYTPFDVYNPVYGQPEFLYGYNCGEDSSVVPAHYLAQLPVCENPDLKTTQTGTYLQDQIRLGNWLGIVGMRKDWIETLSSEGTTQKDSNISYRAGLMYEFDFGLTPYVSYGESFIPVVARTQSGAPLKPQQGRMYEVGFKYQPAGSSFAINGALYDIAENNRLTGDVVPGFYVQEGAITSKGGEIEFTGKLTKNLKLAGGYSYTLAQYDDNSAVDGNQIESVPKHMASLWGVWEFDQPDLKGWSVGAGARYIGSSADANEAIEVPAVTLFDAMIAYEVEHWRWQITAQNIEDKEVVTTCLSRGDCFLGQARTIITGLTYKY